MAHGRKGLPVEIDESDPEPVDRMLHGSRLLVSRGRCFRRQVGCPRAFRDEMLRQQPLGIAVEDVMTVLVRNPGEENGAGMIMLAVPRQVAPENDLSRAGGLHHVLDEPIDLG